MRQERKTLREIVEFLKQKYEIETTISSLNSVIKSYLRKPDPYAEAQLKLASLAQTYPVLAPSPSLPHDVPIKNEEPVIQGIPEPEITDWETKLRAARRKATFNEMRFFKQNATPEQLEVHRQIISSKPQAEFNWLCYQMEAAPNLYQDNHND